MSLSEVPQAKVNPLNTPREIAEKIWVATLQYTEEVQSTQSVYYASLLWTAFLFSQKKNLEEHRLLEEVRKQYIHTVSWLYGVSLDEVEELAELKSKTNLFWDVLNKDNIDLSNSTEVLIILEILEDTKPSIAESPECAPMSEQVRCFQRNATLLSIQIKRLIIETNEKKNIKIKLPEGVKEVCLSAEGSQPHHYGNYNIQGSDISLSDTPTQKAAPAYQPVYNSNANKTQIPEERRRKEEEEKIKRKEKAAKVAIVILSAVLVYLGYCYWSMFQPTTKIDNSEVTVDMIKELMSGEETKEETKPNLPKPIARPASGTILSGEEDFNGSEIIVTADKDNDCVVSLKTGDGRECVTFYVRAGETATVGVPAEYFYIYFASGNIWYGYGKGLMFGEDTFYSKDDNIRAFTGGMYWEYTLYPVTDGNFTQTPSNAEEFF